MKICYLKIDVSCEASVNFHHISQNAMPATEFAPCHHLTQAWQCDWQEARNTTCSKCCACHAKKRWARPKCCARDENCNTSSENVAKLFSPSTQNDFWHVWMSRSATPATRNEATRHVHTCATFKSDPFCRTRDGHMGRLRTVADGWARSTEHTLNPQTPRVKREPVLRIREKKIPSIFNNCHTCVDLPT